MRHVVKRWFNACLICTLLPAAQIAVAGTASDRLAGIRSRGTLNCGIWPYVAGFAIRTSDSYAGFDIDTCRAVAASLFGDASKVNFVELTHVEQFLQRADIDLAVRRLTSSPDREAATGTIFGPVTFHDGQGFLVPGGIGAKKFSDLPLGPICVINAERHPKILYQFLRSTGRQREIVLVETDADAERALRESRCVVYSADVSWLAAARAGFADGVVRYDILPDRISEEPLAPLMRADDVCLSEVVRWTIAVLLEAETLGVSSDNVASDWTRLLRAVNLSTAQWPSGSIALESGASMRAIISGVGNYAQMYERNLGAASGLELERGRNRLSIHGGWMSAPDAVHGRTSGGSVPSRTADCETESY